MGTHPIFESDFDCLTDYFVECLINDRSSFIFERHFSVCPKCSLGTSCASLSEATPSCGLWEDLTTWRSQCQIWTSRRLFTVTHLAPKYPAKTTSRSTASPPFS